MWTHSRFLVRKRHRRLQRDVQPLKHFLNKMGLAVSIDWFAADQWKCSHDLRFGSSSSDGKLFLWGLNNGVELIHLDHSSFCSFKSTMSWSNRDQQRMIGRDLMHRTATKSIQSKIHGPQRTDILVAPALDCTVELLCWSKTSAKLQSHWQTSYTKQASQEVLLNLHTVLYIWFI